MLDRSDTNTEAVRAFSLDVVDLYYSCLQPVAHPPAAEKRDIASLTGRPLSSINRIVKAFRDEQRLENLPRGSRSKATTDDEDRMIVAAAVDDPTLTAKEIQAELNLQALSGSLVMDEMSLKKATTYKKQSDTVHGLVDLGVPSPTSASRTTLQTTFFASFLLPKGYYFTKALTEEQLQLLALKVMESIEEAGFQVVRLQHGQRLGAPDFEDCLPTVEFTKLVYRWFVLHNLKSTAVHVTSRDTMRMPFCSPDDERLSWLQGDCLAYFASWKASTTHKMEFLSAETYEALRRSCYGPDSSGSCPIPLPKSTSLAWKAAAENRTSDVKGARQANATDNDRAMEAKRKLRVLATTALHAG
ncbi:hypothetical protein HPB47_002800 [Ixodes persulcatus]|uniref:Uncharacterized protein n=1 Tax=Ixodes persulcatus TaxID=34615 RepID=A0AC60R0N8_IXOPE|nr:hypothetical protein HPB47_002800 [Ixodes persulcatus]